MTKHHYFFTTLLLVAASQQLYAMKNDEHHISEPKILATFTGIEEPTQVMCFSDIIAVAGENGCSLFDLSGKEIRKLCDNTVGVLGIAGHPNKKLLAIKDRKNLTVYDIKRNEVWITSGKNCIGRPDFNPIVDTFVIGNNSSGINLFDYRNNSCKTLNNVLPNNVSRVKFHPAKKEFIYFNSNVPRQSINICQLDQDSINMIKCLSQGININTCEYSRDGSLIACFSNDSQQLLILDHELESVQYSPLIEDRLSTIKYHPTSFVLAILSAQRKFIYYWNTKTQNLITKTPLIHISSNWIEYSEAMNYFPDGTKIAVALEDKTIMLEVPFITRYKNLTEDKTIFIYWLLKNYIHDGQPLPRDIAQFAINKLLEASKYSFTNY